jgi:hypothetical protein
MLYLFASIILFSINNLLWTHYAPKQSIYLTIFKRSSFTSLFIGIIFVGVLFYSQQVFPTKELLNLFMISCVGFAGLSFLVLGFKKGSILQYAIYSLLFTFVLGFLTEYHIQYDSPRNIFSLLFVSFGYLYFIFKQFNEQKIALKSKQAHAYFFLAHLCFAFLLLLQMEFLKSISQVVIALTQELSIFILAGLVLLIQPRTTQVNKIPIWHFVLFAIPLTLAVLLGLEGLKNTNPFHSLLIGLLTPIITLLLGVFFGKEILNLKSLPGLLIMIFGMLVFYL